MDKQAGTEGAQRIKGGFRRMLITELGEEQICGTCHESWPIDSEFFIVTQSSLSYQCKACISEQNRRKRRTPLDAASLKEPGGLAHLKGIRSRIVKIS